jgi:hypothetical protein
MDGAWRDQGSRQLERPRCLVPSSLAVPAYGIVSFPEDLNSFGALYGIPMAPKENAGQSSTTEEAIIKAQQLAEGYPSLGVGSITISERGSRLALTARYVKLLYVELPCLHCCSECTTSNSYVLY